MRHFVLAVSVVLTACIFEIPEDAADHFDRLTESAEVALVVCVPASLSIALQQRGECSAFNAAGTVIEIGGFAPVIWESDDPAAISITTDGKTFTGTVVNPAVIITARGPNGTSATFTMSSF